MSVMKMKSKVRALDLSEVMDRLKEKGATMDNILGSDVPDEVKEILAEIMGEAAGGGAGATKKFENILESQVELSAYMATLMPREGAFVERNEFGALRYNSPDAKNNEAAVVVEVWPTYKQEVEGNGVVNGVIAVSERKGVVRLYCVDLRLYKEVTAGATARSGVTH